MLPILTLAVALSGSPDSLAAVRPAATGRIAGQVTLSSSVTSRKMRFRLYADYGPAGSAPTRSETTGSEMANVVIYLDSAPAGDRRTERRIIAQRDEMFAPHVLAVERGETVTFRNDDPFFHNVFSLSSAKSFDLGRYPRGRSKTVEFDRSGIVKTFCHIHADMSAAILVLDNPYFTSPDESGAYLLDHVPPGDYRIVAWHERVKPVTGRVRVVAGETATVDFNLPVPNELATSDRAGH